LENKNIAITILIVALVASGVGNIVLAIMGGTVVSPPSTSDYLVRATSAGPDTLELVDAWDSASNDVLEQVVENLFFYDLFNVSLPRINLLAYSYYWVDTTHLKIQLREGIKFHDGTDFNAAAAKWNFDRLLFLTNCTGTNTETVAQTQSLWMFPDGETPIIDSVVTVGEYNITITLNGPYAPFLSTLTYINAGMISPTAHAADAEEFIDLTTGKLVGTGPFKYEKYVPGVEVRFTRNDAYWMKPANFPGVIFAIYSDVTTAHNAFLGYTVDWNAMSADQNLALYEADPKLEVYRFTEETGKPSLVYQYMGYNNHKYNATWRQAMSYAINYTYVIDVLRLGNAFRAYSAISPGFGGAWNGSIETGPYAIDYDVAEARNIIQSMGLGLSLVTDQDWIDVAEGTTPFLTVLHTYNTGNAFREDYQVAITTWYKLIGVKVVDDGVTFSEFLGYLYDNYDHLGIYAIGWAPDYLDPYNMLDPLFNPVSSSNSAQVDDAHLNALMLSALSETDEGARNTIYQNIQGYLAKMQFHAPLYHSRSVYTHAANLYNIPYNAMGALRIYPVYRGLFPPF
jgi:peptide/nickel transport system substrate-binding protein